MTPGGDAELRDPLEPQHVAQVITAATDWVPALDADGDLREHVESCKITGLLEPTGRPGGTWFIVR
ncbi:hypothetical protein [Micromonospora sp. WMMD980]|uniref:hypothetical protein n=1 Tax=Micromonospora sp. WMMD980 TaxID=3016088 RepID=UPI002416C842|nr:hypothetical protein [Micromonospora sp. WMMD980]MDG4803122.1 hypothetical protein [Micromonospora sp. WMMD980]